MRRSFFSPSLPVAAFSVALAGLVASAPRPTRAADANNYEVTSVVPKASAGVKVTASVIIASTNGWHLNEEAPMTVKLSPGAGVTVEKSKLGRADAAEKTKDKARFDVPFTAGESGAKTIDAEASFVICQETACKPVKAKLALAIDVAAPAGKKKK
jgi:DsbC/DsbD-like thiol-disulfide interchange protein